MTLTEMHIKALAEFEGRRYCSPDQAARYLNIGRRTLDELLNAQEIRSQYFGRTGKKRQVIVATLLDYADKLPIDRPEAS